MNTPEDSRLPDDPLFQALLVQCLEMFERGEYVNLEAIEQEHPQYAAELR